MRFDLNEQMSKLSLDSLSVSDDESTTLQSESSSVIQGLEYVDEEEDDTPPSLVFVPVTPRPPVRRSSRTRRRPLFFMDEYDKYYR